MPDLGKYEKVPRPESREQLIKYLRVMRVIKDIQEIDYQIINITRDNKPSVKVFLTNIYIVSLADTCKITGENPDIEAIVTMSGWNGYSMEAKSECKKNGIGLFTFKEFLGAIWYDGSCFIDYTPPKRDN